MKKMLALMSICFLLVQAYAQNRTITGKVTDEKGVPIPLASVTVKGTNISTSANDNGIFLLSIPGTAKTLVITSVNYKNQEIGIGDNSNFTVTLISSNTKMDEVVVTAIGITRSARSMGAAAATLKADVINDAKVTNVANGLTGKVSGLQINTINNGIDPDLKITLRGSRSITGNNQALVVLDGVPVAASILASLNPEDVENITVLKGANAAALYGSDATNGALIITTKKGRAGQLRISYSSSIQTERISFFPKFQNKFGMGSTSWNPKFDPIENQQYGPAYDGSEVELGEKLEDGSIQKLTYVDRLGEKKKFFNTGLNYQNSISVSSGGDKGTFFMSYQNTTIKGIVPKDKSSRNVFRLAATREVGKFTVGGNVTYSQRRMEQTNAGVYWNIFNTASFIPITEYSDWQNNKFANPNGYYNGYYQNPYFQLDNNRKNRRNDNFTGTASISGKITEWFGIDYRLGLTAENNSSKAYTGKFDYTPYTVDNQTGTKSNISGNVTDEMSFVNRLNSDFMLSFQKKFKKLDAKLILGQNAKQNSAKYESITANALYQLGDVFNVNNRVGELDASTSGNASYTSRSSSVFADLTVGYHNYLFVHASIRKDGVSILNQKNRSFLYPGADLSFIFSDAIPGLRNSRFLTMGKLRGGLTKVGQVNLPRMNSTFGAYSLIPVYNVAAGFPYGSLNALAIDNKLIDPNLKPEFTRSAEIGLDLNFAKDLITLELTYYSQRSTNQTLEGEVSRASGYNKYLLNAGTLTNNGLEVDLKLNPLKGVSKDFKWLVGINYNFNENKVVELNGENSELPLSTGGNANVYAIKGGLFPAIKGSVYKRDPATGGIILMPYKAPDGTIYYVPEKDAAIVNFGNASPKHKLGINNQFKYKGFTLNAVVDSRWGYIIYNTIGENLDFTGAGARNAQYDRKPFVMPNSVVAGADGKYVINTNQLTPGGVEFWASAAYNTSVAENYVTKGNFWKLRELSLSYELPQNLLRKIGYIKSASIGVFGRNLITWLPKENIYADPEYSRSMSETYSENAVGINTYDQTPPTRMIGGTLSINF